MQWSAFAVAMALMAETAGAAAGRWRPPAEREPIRQSGDATATGPAIGAGLCAAFAEPDYRGAVLRVRGGQSLEWVGRAWDNRISSIVCAPGCRLIGYQHINYGGPRANFTGATARLHPVFDDRISAARAVCGSETGH